MRTIKILFTAHCIAIFLSLVGLLVMLPHPELWDTTPAGIAVFTFSLTYGGSLYVLLGAATMLLFGLRFVGVKKTLIFFFAATLISLSMELLGTSTGFPFGPYAYTNLLGYKILGHVPYPIPLSWFYMGFTSYLLANLLVGRTGWRRKTLWTLLLGAYFLTVWDLSLDPAMASARLPLQFWNWYTAGSYFGMPISNLIGWSITGLTYMSVSRLLWRGNLDISRLVAWLPFGVYAVNTCFAIALTLDAGIWQPSLTAVLLGLLPATLVLLSGSRGSGGGGYKEGLFGRISRLVLLKSSTGIVNKNTSSMVVGLEHIPQNGPVLIVAHHFHHLYDGCLLLKVVPRRLHILVGLDWIEHAGTRWLMELFCHAVAWPIMLRGERLEQTETRSVYRISEARPYLRRASLLVRQLLRQGEALVIFPEAYPNIDPVASPKESQAAFLPFRSGFVRFLELAERQSGTCVPIIPAGLHYTREPRWQITLRFGPALFRKDFADATQLVQVVEQQVRALSAPEIAPLSLQTQL